MVADQITVSTFKEAGGADLVQDKDAGRVRLQRSRAAQLCQPAWRAHHHQRLVLLYGLHLRHACQLNAPEPPT